MKVVVTYLHEPDRGKDRITDLSAEEEQEVLTILQNADASDSVRARVNQPVRYTLHTLGHKPRYIVWDSFVEDNEARREGRYLFLGLRDQRRIKAILSEALAARGELEWKFKWSTWKPRR